MTKGKNGVKIVKPKKDTTEWVIYRMHSCGNASWGQYWDGNKWGDPLQAKVYVGLASIPTTLPDPNAKVGRAAFKLLSPRPNPAG